LSLYEEQNSSSSLSMQGVGETVGAEVKTNSVGSLVGVAVEGAIEGELEGVAVGDSDGL
jgi:hypothetical protein